MTIGSCGGVARIAAPTRLASLPPCWPGPGPSSTSATPTLSTPGESLARRSRPLHARPLALSRAASAVPGVRLPLSFTPTANDLGLIAAGEHRVQDHEAVSSCAAPQSASGLPGTGQGAPTAAGDGPARCAARLLETALGLSTVGSRCQVDITLRVYLRMRVHRVSRRRSAGLALPIHERRSP